MAPDRKYHVVEMSVFKAKLCEYMRAVAAGEGEFVIRRYKESVAVVRSLRRMQLDRDADLAHAGLNAYLTARRRFVVERRIIAARALGWPPQKFACLGRNVAGADG